MTTCSGRQAEYLLLLQIAAPVNLIMGKKCCVMYCKSGYDSYIKKNGQKFPLYSFPKDEHQRRLWVRAIPNNLGTLLPNHRVCGRHFVNVKMVTGGNGVQKPMEPPNFFGDGIPSSITNTATKTEIFGRSTKKAAASSRNQQACQMPSFEKMNKFSLEDTVDKRVELFSDTVDKRVNKLKGLVAWAEDKKSFVIISSSRVGPVNSYTIYCEYSKLKDNATAIKELEYEAYIGLQRYEHPLFKKIMTGWDQFDALMHHLELSTDDDRMPSFLDDQVRLINTPDNTKTLYDVKDLLTAFQWYTISRPLYKQLRLSLKLPSISTLQKVTRLSKNFEDRQLFTAFFMKQPDRFRGCIVVVDEVYVKASITYSGEFSSILINLK